MSARENLVFWGKMYGLSGDALKQRVDEVLELITLVDRQKDRVEKFSGGMKRRVNIGVALLHRPKVLYLDEPTVGIDPQSRRSILDGILALRDQGMTILYTTHYMAEAQELSDRIGIVDHGKMIAIGTHEELVKIVGEGARVTARVDHYLEGMAERWREVKGVDKVDVEDDEAVLLTEDPNEVLPRLFEAAAAAGSRITEINVTEPNLEMVFLHLTGRALREYDSEEDPRHRVEGPAQHAAQPPGAGHDAGRAARVWPPCSASPSAAATSFDIAATKVVVANLDKGGAEPGQNAGAAIQKILASKDLSDILAAKTATSAAAARKAVDDGDAEVAVIIPADFSSVVYGSDPAATSQVELYENPTAEIGGSIVEGVVGQVLADFNGARAAAAGAVALRRRRRSLRVHGGRPRGRDVHPRGRRLGRAAGHPALTEGRQVGQRRQRHRLHPRRHDDLLHVLRRRQRRADDPHRGPRRHHAAPVHHADAARHDHRRQVRRGVRHGTRAGDRAPDRRTAHLQHPLGPHRRRGPAHRRGRRRGRRPRAARHLVRQDAGAGGRHRLRRLPGPRAARRQLHRHRPDRHHLRVHPAVHAQRLAAPWLGHGDARRRR